MATVAGILQSVARTTKQLLSSINRHDHILQGGSLPLESISVDPKTNIQLSKILDK